MDNIKLAWLAGFWDGEGSIGLVSNKKTKVIVVQLSHTERDSVVEILRILKAHGVSGRGYAYQEKDPTKHRDAHYMRITGIANALKMARLLKPFSVTKQRHWQLAIQWCESRIKVAGGLDSKGHLKRGGIAGWNPYSRADMKMAKELSRLNRRGPAVGRKQHRHGRIIPRSAV